MVGKLSRRNNKIFRPTYKFIVTPKMASGNGRFVYNSCRFVYRTPGITNNDRVLADGYCNFLTDRINQLDFLRFLQIIGVDNFFEELSRIDE
jgi:hypothetical protein